MKLRARLFLTVVAVAAPLVPTFFLIRDKVMGRALVSMHQESVVEMMKAGRRAECEADPVHFGGPESASPSIPPGSAAKSLESADDGASESRRTTRQVQFQGWPRPPPFGDREPPELWAYDPTFGSANPKAPPFPPSIREALESGETSAGGRATLEGKPALEIGVRMPWAVGPCAYILARQTLPPMPDRSWLFFLTVPLPLAILVATILVALGPVVGRVRRLTVGVRRSASSRYEEPVSIEGHDEIAALATAFNEAGLEVRGYLLEAARQERTLREFLANTTHDLMAPLTVLQGNLAELREEAIAKAGGSTPGSISLTQAIEEAAHLGALVHNLGAAAKLESGPALASLHPLDLCALVERVVARHRPLAEPRGVALEHAVPERAVFIEADVTLIEQAIGNLVLNAIRHNAPNGHAAVVLKASAADQTFSLLVTDDGPGVSAEDLAHLGERGWRGPGGDRHVDGRGLGLHIARSVAERHQMSLQFRASEYGGLEAELTGRIRSDPREGGAGDDPSSIRGQP